MPFGFKLWFKNRKKRKMNDNPCVKKLVQITEEAQKPVHIPIVFGNECFVVTQQDMRKIEDTRLLTYCKLTPKGELIPMELLGHNPTVSDAILNACKYRMQIDQTTAATDVNLLLELLTKILCNKQTQNMELCNNESMQHEQSPACIATMEQQLQWAKANNNSSLPFPLTHNSATSTTDTSVNRATSTLTNCYCCTRGCNTAAISENRATSTSSKSCCCRCEKPQIASYAHGCNTTASLENKATSTYSNGCNRKIKDLSKKCHSKSPPRSAREQLKQKKMTQDNLNCL